MLALVLAAAPSRGADFAIPAALRPQVDFWVAVFATYSKHQMVIHDAEHLDRVYSILDFRDLAAEGMSDDQIGAVMRAREESEKERVRALLLELDAADADQPLGAEAQRLRALFAADRSPTKYRDAAASDRLRGQRGLRERFAQGLMIANGYFPEMERIFRSAGVPPEITRLPMVESTFNMKAYSKVGAAGVWQFMPGTARNFMRVNDVVDERLDPLVATRAAAQFMRQNYEKLGSWPLAIKAYNHGPAGMARAVRDTGTTDIAVIIQNYKGPAFKVASRNFYPEFLAALHVERNARKYFGELPARPRPESETVVLDGPTSLTSAARCTGTDPWTLAELNPSLLPPAKTGRAAVPAGYSLRVPPGAAARLDRCVAALPPAVMTRRDVPSQRRAKSERPSARVRTVHRVRPGQTLSSIAARYGCSVDQLRRGNGLRSGAVKSGQLLRIPPC
ncbi:MAG: transglycosylase SLT domain-containing protein [Deltaproteobacteria bacterium]|nr:transglycosylase SLT domain-containing protein [Deltaproteobacteria bacterium]